MNYLKRILLSLGLLASGSLFAAILQDPGFDIVNKAPNKKAIYVTVINGRDTLLDKIEVPSALGQDEGKLKEWAALGKEFLKAQFKGLQVGSVRIDKDQPVKLLIYRSLTDKDPIAHTFTKAKTIYVTYDGKLRPQTGRLGGLLGYSRKGYDLGSNVKTEDIKATTATEALETEQEEAGGLKDPAYEPKSKYTKQEWIDWYESGGYTADQYTPWLKGAKADSPQ